jgi:polyisoprenoid-binding protein YceI
VTVAFGVKHLGLSTYVGRFNTVSGKLTFNPAEPEKSSVEIAIDMASADTTSDKLDTKLRDEAFEASAFPTATFVSTKVTRTGETTGTVEGTLTLHGVSQPLTLDVVFNGGREHPFSKTYALGFSATASLKRSAFGVDDWAMAAADDVTLTIEAEFIAQ